MEEIKYVRSVERPYPLWVCHSVSLHVHQSQKLSERLHSAQTVKRLPAVRETRVRSLDWEDLLEKEMATYSSTLAWKIPRTEEPVRLQSMGSQSQTRLSDFTSLNSDNSHNNNSCVF